MHPAAYPREAHDMAVLRMVQAGAVPITWIAVMSEWQRDWARERPVRPSPRSRRPRRRIRHRRFRGNSNFLAPGGNSR